MKGGKSFPARVAPGAKLRRRGGRIPLIAHRARRLDQHPGSPLPYAGKRQSGQTSAGEAIGPESASSADARLRQTGLRSPRARDGRHTHSNE
ncbi:hypothetical protein PJI16_19255 [Nitrospira sp. MA-1]|nr:hypothetical protein [Nitrospira sp. MA-1]